MADKQTLEVTVEEVNKEQSEVYVTTEEGQSNWLKIVGPADVKWAKIGKATCTIQGGQITYLKSLEPKTEFKKPWANKTGYNKPSYPSNTTQSSKPSPFSGYNKANPVIPKEDEDKESRYIGQIMVLTDVSPAEIEMKVNTLARSKWVKAWQEHPKANGKYDVFLTVMEKRENLIPNQVAVFIDKEAYNQLEQAAKLAEMTVDETLNSMFKSDVEKS